MKKRNRAQAAAIGLAVVFALFSVVWLYQTTERIRGQSRVDEAQPADAILIMGAAEYRGRPSPVFKARLDHGLELFRRGLAPRLITTGGAGGDPDFTEGSVGRDYLIMQGVPGEAIVVEREASSTVESTAAVGEIMQRMGLERLILVSDGYHIYRAKRMLESRGLQVFGSPRLPAKENDGWAERWLYLRQAVGFALWKVGISI